jgi:hypothetical protein
LQFFGSPFIHDCLTSGKNYSHHSK